MQYFIISLLTVILDQWLKIEVSKHLALGAVRELIPGLISLTHAENRGVSFGFLSDSPNLLVIISGLTVVVCLALIFAQLFAERLDFDTFPRRLSLSLLLGGAFGNFIDRTAFSQVTDMLQFDFVNFAIFNLADVFLTCGTALLIIVLIKEVRDHRVAATPKLALATETVAIEPVETPLVIEPPKTDAPNIELAETETATEVEAIAEAEPPEPIEPEPAIPEAIEPEPATPEVAEVAEAPEPLELEKQTPDARFDWRMAIALASLSAQPKEVAARVRPEVRAAVPPGRSELILTVGTENAGERLDVFLARFLGSRSAAVRAAGSLSFAKSYRVQPGDAFNLTEFIATAPEPYSAEAEDIPLDIIYEDEDLIVVNKAKGIVVHPAPGHYGGTLVNALLHHCAGSLSGIGGELRPGIVHRIDKDTSGLLIVAKNDFAHRELAAQLVDHSLSRTYEAVIRGSFAEDFGTISQPLGRAAGSSPNDRKRMAVRSDGKPAITHWERIAGYSGYTHIRCKLETGRTHQIRVHLAYTGHPVLGDVLYGAGNKLGKTPLPFEGQCLHAKELTFVHPRTKETVHLESDLPEYFKWVLDILSDDG